MLEKKDYTGAVHLWQAGVLCQPGEVNAIIELVRALLLVGNKKQARQWLRDAQKLDSSNIEVADLLKKMDTTDNGIKKSFNHKRT